MSPFVAPTSHGMSIPSEVPALIPVPAQKLAEVQVLSGDPVWLGSYAELAEGVGLRFVVGERYCEPLGAEGALYAISEGPTGSTITWKSGIGTVPPAEPAAPATTTLAAPTNFTAADTGDTVQLSWTAVDGAEWYYLSRDPGGNPPLDTGSEVMLDATATGYTDTTPQTAGTVTYSLYAGKPSASVWSETVTATVTLV